MASSTVNPFDWPCSKKKLRAICLDLGLVANNGTAAEQAHTIMQCFAGCRKLLEKWRDETKLMFPNRLDLLQMIPKPEIIDVMWLLGGVLEHDTCATAQSLGYKLQHMIFAIVRDKDVPSNELMLYQGECHNHLQCVWFEHVSIILGDVWRLEVDSKPLTCYLLLEQDINLGW